jgi:hypothetical protein
MLLADFFMFSLTSRIGKEIYLIVKTVVAHYEWLVIEE